MPPSRNRAISLAEKRKPQTPARFQAARPEDRVPVFREPQRMAVIDAKPRRPLLPSGDLLGQVARYAGRLRHQHRGPRSDSVVSSASGRPQVSTAASISARTSASRLSACTSPIENCPERGSGSGGGGNPKRAVGIPQLRITFASVAPLPSRPATNERPVMRSQARIAAPTIQLFRSVREAGTARIVSQPMSRPAWAARMDSIAVANCRRTSAGPARGVVRRSR